MPTISRHGKGWRAQIRRLGHPPQSRTFPLKSQAWEWATRAERELITGTFQPTKHTLRQAFEKYAREVSPKKRGARWEDYRLTALGLATMAAKPIAALTPADIGAWRDARLRAVAGATVRREMNLIDSVLEVARKEWTWLKVNPARDVQKPANPPPRRRRIPQDEIDRMVKELRGPAGHEVAQGFLLGVETAMRAGEMWSLERPQIDLKAGVVHLLKTKNGDERDVALTPAAIAIVEALLADKRPRLFTITNAVRDALFRKARDALGIQNLHFHDSRAEAIFRLSTGPNRLDLLELARQVGHRDPKSLLFYYQADAAAIAKRLASPSRKPKPRRPPSADRKKDRAP